MADVTKEDCVVMVTGGSGMLGQHVIKLLNTHADHVNSIRIVDILPFENKLDYKPIKPIRSYVGSIIDEDLMREVMKGCHSVIHLAAIKDHSMFPNKEKLQKINIEGTATTLDAAQKSHSVKRFIGCGTFSVIKDSNNTSIINGTEEILIPTKWLFQDYVSTKYVTERQVLGANSEEFSTVVLRPPTMYGELDDMYVVTNLRLAKQNGGTLLQVNCGDNEHQQAYVGNVAWGFICAEKMLYEEQKALNTIHKQEGFQESGVKANDEIKDLKEHVPDRYKNLQSIAGQAYFIGDDTPNQNVFQFTQFFVTACGYSISRRKIPYYLVLIPLYSIYIFFNFLSLFGIKLNMSYSIPAIRFLNSSLTTIYDKASTRLGYVPLFTPEEAKEKSVCFYKEVVENWKKLS